MAKTPIPINDIGLDLALLDVGKGARAFSTMRGVSPVWADFPYAGFSVCHYTGDDPERIEYCRELIAGRFGLGPEDLIIPRQTHSANVAVIGDSIPDLNGVDALVTRRSDVALCINTADCIPLALNDPQAGVIGIVHAGWRGLDGGIITAAIQALAEQGADPAEIKAAFGPFICADCYEVDEEFAARFAEKFPDAGAIVTDRGVKGKRNLDLGAIATYQLKAAGIRPENISLPPECNHCHSDLWFSARSVGAESGRILTIIRKTS